MQTLAAIDSPASAPYRYLHATEAGQLEQMLAVAREDAHYVPSLYGTLLSGEVYVTDCEMVLGDEGPYVELCPRRDAQGRVLAVYPSAERAPDPREAQPVSFISVLAALSSGVAVVLDPGGSLHYRIDPIELELLRRVLD